MRSHLRRALVSPLLRWSLVVAWAGVIFAGSSIPGSGIPGEYSVYGHLTEYFVMGVLTALALNGRERRTLLVALLICALYAASDEFHQAFVPMRTPDPLDWITDVTGATLGALSLILWTNRRSPRSATGRQ